MKESLPEQVRATEKIDSPEDAELRARLKEFMMNNDEEGLMRFVKEGWHYDKLTGVRNLRGFEHDTKVMLKGIKRRPPDAERRADQIDHEKNHDEDFAFFMIDIDHFKAVNDTYGHAAGDQALKLVASELTRTLREQDIVGRIGGEEFGVLMKGEKAGDRFAVAERVRHAIEALECVHDGKRINLTVSIGIAKYLPGEDLADTKKRADGALYAAKTGGRNQYASSEE